MKVGSLKRFYGWLTRKPTDSELIKQLDLALSGGYHSQDWLIKLRKQ